MEVKDAAKHPTVCVTASYHADSVAPDEDDDTLPKPWTYIRSFIFYFGFWNISSLSWRLQKPYLPYGVQILFVGLPGYPSINLIVPKITLTTFCWRTLLCSPWVSRQQRLVQQSRKLSCYLEHTNLFSSCSFTPQRKTGNIQKHLWFIVNERVQGVHTLVDRG